MRQARVKLTGATREDGERIPSGGTKLAGVNGPDRHGPEMRRLQPILGDIRHRLYEKHGCRLGDESILDGSTICDRGPPRY